MSGRRRWAVLVPGEASWVERRAREFLEQEEDGSEHHFMVVPGQGRYQAIVEKGHQDFSSEMLLGEALSRECEDPVFAIQRVDEFFHVSRFLKGKEYWEEKEPDDLIRSLGCANEWTVEPPFKPWKKTARTVVLIQGLSATRVLNALTKRAGDPLPAGAYSLEELPQGLLLTDGTRGLEVADIDLAYRFPRATFYAVTATPDLGFFQVNVRHNKKAVEFVPQPGETSSSPVVHEIMGEREPERILAALGIPKEWFHL